MILALGRRIAIAWAGATLLGTMATSAATASFSYDDWNSVLARFVDGQGLVDYSELASDRAALDRYLSVLQHTSPESHPELFPTPTDRLAYYINAYNAYVFHGVLQLAPDAHTVWGLTGTGYRFFRWNPIVLGGRRTTLQELEDETIRAGFKEPRIHAALNCASRGCPRLPREAFDPSTLDQQLDRAMKKFVADPGNCRIDRSSGTVTLSKIFDWFREDFEQYELQRGGGGLVDYVNRFRAADAQIPAGLTIEFASYDRSLNRQ